MGVVWLICREITPCALCYVPLRSFDSLSVDDRVGFAIECDICGFTALIEDSRK